MKVIIHDLGPEYDAVLKEIFDITIDANGKYAPCQGCFGCWTKTPAACFINDTLKLSCRTLGKAENLVIVTQNCYGTYSPAVKNVLDRSIGSSTPLSTYRGKQMHHTLRYSRHDNLTVYAYGQMTDSEKSTFELMVQRNAINDGYKKACFKHYTSIEALKEALA